ncbi:MAG: sulfurtransferase TusA family protein [Candidatus Melainabacteria bacterium]
MTTTRQTLDLRTTKCPLNFVKTKLALEKLAPGDVLEIWIATDGESAINIPNSLRQEGHQVVATENHPDGYQQLWIERS